MATPVLSWVNLILIIILIMLVAVIYFVYFFRADNLEREGLAWNLIQNKASDTSSKFTAGNYTLFINNATAAIKITIDPNSKVITGQEFQIYNAGGSAATIIANSGVKFTTTNITDGLVVKQGDLATFIATSDNNDYQRIQ